MGTSQIVHLMAGIYSHTVYKLAMKIDHAHLKREKKRGKKKEKEKKNKQILWSTRYKSLIFFFPFYFISEIIIYRKLSFLCWRSDNCFKISNFLNPFFLNLNRSSKMAFTTQEFGSRNSADYRVFFKNSEGNVISPWHDIPLFADQANKIYNMVVEIPRWTNPKMEIATKEPMNPIKQDTKKGALRYVRNPFPHHGYIWNYGALPQTWEDPNHVDAGTNAKGDNDPIDVIEIGQKIAQRGEVFKVKVLGTLALIDEGETDWKLIAINVDDPLAEKLNDIEDIQKHMPGFLAASVEWFKIYKIPDGKPANVFAFNGEAKNREFAEKVINETHKFWKELVAKTTNDSDLDLKNVTGKNSFTIKSDEANAFIKDLKSSKDLPETKINDQSSIDKVYYIQL